MYKITKDITIFKDHNNTLDLTLYLVKLHESRQAHNKVQLV